jgi:Uma2 family endonuclease
MYNRAMPVVYETEAPLAPRSGLGPYREADYLGLPDEPRCELLYGRLLVTPAPTARHQHIVFKIARILADCADRHGDQVLVSPIDVVLADHSVVQPDVVYVRAARSSIVRDRVEGAPDLVVEVLSPGTARRDLGEKLRLYAEAGVAEYWIIDPGLQTLELLINAGGGFRVNPPDGPTFRSAAIPGLELDLEAFWRSIPGR